MKPLAPQAANFVVKAGKPISCKLKKWVREGRIEPEELCAEKLKRIRELKWNLATLAINELIRNNNCMRCYGTGRKDYTDCTRCKGSGKSPMSVTYKCDWLFISCAAWQTWASRYDLVYQEFRFWLQTWEAHVMTRGR